MSLTSYRTAPSRANWNEGYLVRPKRWCNAQMSDFLINPGLPQKSDENCSFVWKLYFHAVLLFWVGLRLI